MSESIKQKMNDYLASHDFLRLATVDGSGKPIVHTLGYASEGSTVYFATHKKTRKFKNILKNPYVAYTVDEDYRDISRIQGIQMEAKAVVLSDKAQINKAAALLMKKFSNMPELPLGIEVVFIKAEPNKGVFLDYTKGFMHIDKVAFT